MKVIDGSFRVDAETVDDPAPGPRVDAGAGAGFIEQVRVETGSHPAEDGSPQLLVDLVANRTRPVVRISFTPEDATDLSEKIRAAALHIKQWRVSLPGRAGRLP